MYVRRPLTTSRCFCVMCRCQVHRRRGKIFECLCWAIFSWYDSIRDVWWRIPGKCPVLSLWNRCWRYHAVPCSVHCSVHDKCTVDVDRIGAGRTEPIVKVWREILGFKSYIWHAFCLPTKFTPAWVPIKIYLKSLRNTMCTLRIQNPGHYRDDIPFLRDWLAGVSLTWLSFWVLRCWAVFEVWYDLTKEYWVRISI